MKQAELQHYRALLQAQAVETPGRRRLFGPGGGPVIVRVEPAFAPSPRAGAAAARRPSLFGRRHPEPEPATAEPLLLHTPMASPGGAALRLRLHPPKGGGPFAETPFLAEDLDDGIAAGPAPGIIAGWSAVKPPSAQIRLLRRLSAVVEAERVGLSARLAAAGVATG